MKRTRTKETKTVIKSSEPKSSKVLLFCWVNSPPLCQLDGEYPLQQEQQQKQQGFTTKLKKLNL